MVDYTMDDLLALQPDWLETFGEDLAYGFEIMPPQVPMLRQCLREKSRAPSEPSSPPLTAGNTDSALRLR